MRVSSINSYPKISKIPSFGQSAVPYPEYRSEYKPSFKQTAVPYPEYKMLNYIEENNRNIIEKLTDKISGLFKPEVINEAVDIKKNIDKIYDSDEKANQEKEPKDQLLSVFA